MLWVSYDPVRILWFYFFLRFYYLFEREAEREYVCAQVGGGAEGEAGS